MNLMKRLVETLGRRPHFVVRVVPVLDDLRAVLWMEAPPGSTVVCRAVVEYDRVPDVEPELREDWSETPHQANSMAPAEAAAVIVPPRLQFDPRTVLNPRFRVKWTTSTGGSYETIVSVRE